MKLRDHYGGVPQAVYSWWMSADSRLCPSEKQILRYIVDCVRVLDIGAGDLRVKGRLTAAGFSGGYETVDTSKDVAHDFSRLEEAPSQAYDGVLALEVLEHIPFEDFDGFIDQILRVIKPGGRIVISTPNAEYYSNIWATDLTHRHPYRLADLAAYMQLRGFHCDQLQRVDWTGGPKTRWRERVRKLVVKGFTRGIFQTDYCRGVQLLARRSPG